MKPQQNDVSTTEQIQKAFDETENEDNIDRGNLSQVIDALGFGKFQILITIVIGLALLADVVEIQLLAVIGPALECSSWKVTKTSIALTTTLVFLGFTICAPLGGLASDRYGRKQSLIIGTVLLLIFGVASAFTSSLQWFLVLRFFCGCCISCIAQCCVLLAEYMPGHMRGRAHATLSTAGPVGSILVILLAWTVITGGHDDDYRWRLLVGLCAFPNVLFLAFSYWLPESLLYLADNGKQEKVRQQLEVVARINGKELNIANLKIHPRCDNSNKHTSSSSKPQMSAFGGCLQLIDHKWRVMTVMIWAMWFFNGLAYYGAILSVTEIVRSFDSECSQHEFGKNTSMHGQTPNPDIPLLCHPLRSHDYIDLIVATSAEFPSLLITPWALDHIGRKPTYMVATGIFSLALAPLLAGCQLSKTVVTLLLFLIRGASFSWMLCNFVYTPENYPTHIRSIAVGVANSFMRIGVMITPYFAQVIMAYSHNFAISAYFGVGILSFVIAAFLPVESRGINLSEIGQDLSLQEADDENCKLLNEEEE